MKQLDLWAKFKSHYLYSAKHKFALDVSRVNFESTDSSKYQAAIQTALDSMQKLESGAIANPDEQRMVGHYWLRDSQLAPNATIKNQIESTLSVIKSFAADVHAGKICPSKGLKFENLLVVGIGGSALGPQFVTQALGTANDKLKLFFFDNTDPDGMLNVLSRIPNLATTLCLVISKSGGTKETRNGQLVAKLAFENSGLSVSKHLVAVTGEGSELDQTAIKEKWLARFPMWDWVGGRTSELSAVGLLPAALQGFDIEALLQGAREMDQLTRQADWRQNPAALLALMWQQLGQGKGQKDMVILPYKDRLELFSRYLQQLVMESLGKEKDLSGKVVNQGISVFGNKGSTDQHAYVQQLREGLNNFFAVFIEVLKDSTTLSTKSVCDPSSLEVEPGITAGDYLSGFYLGTRSALYENARESITITIDEVNAYAVGQLIALFERAVGLYATLVNVNAYHQPGVEAGKKAAQKVLDIQRQIVEYLNSQEAPKTLEQIAQATKNEAAVETIFKTLRHLAANRRITENKATNIFEVTYSKL